MKTIIIAAGAAALVLSLTACNTPGERALGGGAIGGLAGAAIGGLATGHASGALAGAAIGAAGGAVVGAASTPEPEPVYVQEPVPAAPIRSGMPPSGQGRVDQGNRAWSPKDCKYGTMVHHGSVVCSP
ncbi:hypothetical protein [Microvirga lotononidis]|uniref:Glycine zipper domain-containing protein n=1 Tax=Microvirga lotononidis TaxID=864069 RepID=I4YVF7_9HYPH|nr:hypothetical protein [Microvirga lotononidis]EIM27949.1 hypothetical protein MicloDRAFT_00045250 [Microvirga lotononidis]WQO27930.1 hypothetical protein U0023_02140 [Microvirga lotononidis]